MKSPTKFIIKLDKKFKDTVERGNFKLELVSKFNEFENRFMEAEVVSTPIRFNTDIKPGDTLFFHHNIILSDYFHIQDNLYQVPYEPNGMRSNLAIAFKNEDGINMIDHWVFLEPMESSLRITSNIVEIVQDDVQNNRGRIKYGSPALEEMGLYPGDVVYFSKNSDYEMEIEGEKVWRMLTTDLEYAEVKS